MNKKRTNRLVVILNILAIAVFYLWRFNVEFLMSGMASSVNGGKSMYNSFIVEILFNNIQLILTFVHCTLAFFNIICAFQNKKDKKICFWQLIFAIYEIFSAISLLSLIDNLELWNNIILGIIPIILAILNITLIKKNKPTVLHIISYIIVIILSILDLLGILTLDWGIIAVAMQLIYVHYQEKNIFETSTRKIINIILYYVLQLIIVLSFLLIVTYSLLITKINEVKISNGLFELYNKVLELKGNTIKDIYIPVEKDDKYGFINNKGEEKISCEYDRVSYFNQLNINNNTYYIALAKKEDRFYIISKTNACIDINDAIEELLKTLEQYFTQEMNKFESEEEYMSIYLQSCEFFDWLFDLVTSSAVEEIELTSQKFEDENYGKNNVLTEKDSKYYYNNKNYTMIIEPTSEETIENDNYSNEVDIDDMLEDSIKYNVTIIKSNGEKESDIVYLPGIDEENKMLHTFTDGYIEFKDENNVQGWYDNDGNQVVKFNNHIMDIRNDKVILKVEEIDNESIEYIIMNMQGKTLLQTNALAIYYNMYLVKNDNQKMVLLNQDLKTISNEYDRICTTYQASIALNFGSDN